LASPAIRAKGAAAAAAVPRAAAVEAAAAAAAALEVSLVNLRGAASVSSSTKPWSTLKA
jgi:hypothetical protein